MAKIADNIFVPRISARQLARKKQEAAEAEKIGVIKPVPPAKEFADKPDKNSEGSKMVRIIFLVQRVADKSTNPAPKNEQPPDGGGAA